MNNMSLSDFLTCVKDAEVWHAHNRSFSIVRDYRYDYGFRVFADG